jgi:cytochrome c oxidase subunit 2
MRPAGVSKYHLVTALLPLLLGGCGYQTYQNAFGGAGVENRQFQTLFWVFFVICAVMYLLVIAFLIAGILRRRGDAHLAESGRRRPSHPLMRALLIGWSALIGTGLAALAVASFVADRSMANAAAHEQLSLTVTANQWWWDVQYNSPDGTFRTANELHLPVGAVAHITLHSNDVIHSFWLPSLAGKRDLIPGRETDITLVPNKIGVFRGQCAEFCGAEHAHMAFVVDVDSPADFVAWRDRQIQPAPVPHTPLALAGYHVAASGRCAECHTIAGTPAHGAKGPDLTHLASRRSIAAGLLPMRTGNLYGWVANAPALKPGTKMPVSGLEPDELHAVVAYLETLK